MVLSFVPSWLLGFNLLLQRFGRLSRMGTEAFKLQGALMWSKDRGWEPWRVFLQKVAPAVHTCTWDLQM